MTLISSAMVCFYQSSPKSYRQVTTMYAMHCVYTCTHVCIIIYRPYERKVVITVWSTDDRHLKNLHLKQPYPLHRAIHDRIPLESYIPLTTTFLSDNSSIFEITQYVHTSFFPLMGLIRKPSIKTASPEMRKANTVYHSS